MTMINSILRLMAQKLHSWNFFVDKHHNDGIPRDVDRRMCHKVS